MPEDTSHQTPPTAFQQAPPKSIMCSGVSEAGVWQRSAARDFSRDVPGGVVQLSIAAGVLYSYVLGMFLEWELLAMACFAVAILLVAASQFSVESPRWLLLNGRKIEALQALMKLRGMGGRVDNECQAIDHLFAVLPTPVSNVLLAVHVYLLQQFSGITMVILHAHTVLSAPGVAVSASTTSIIIASLQASRPHSVFVLAVSMLWYSVGLGPVVWTLGAELVPCRDSGVFLGTATALNWTCALGVTWMSHALVETRHFSALATFFGVTTLVGTLLTSVFLPETRGQTLEQILIGQLYEPHEEQLSRHSQLGRKM
ncbi:facilitated trehalose transporter Tret1-like [Dermacentor andersoni]|uniref:facilitated trehalose transporter Tret1-like n=1 Tax=Dermacentor andersoni TaxID=34620 RepID=UPI003B3B8F9D